MEAAESSAGQPTSSVVWTWEAEDRLMAGMPILHETDVDAMGLVPLGLNCLIRSEGHARLSAQLRSQINAWGRRVLWRPSKERHVTCPSQNHTELVNETFRLVANASTKLPRVGGQWHVPAILATGKTT